MPKALYTIAARSLLQVMEWKTWFDDNILSWRLPSQSSYMEQIQEVDQRFAGLNASSSKVQKGVAYLHLDSLSYNLILESDPET